ncbi:hypothetical protein LguiB_013528 [Lonicera macranthoides]
MAPYEIDYVITPSKGTNLVPLHYPYGPIPSKRRDTDERKLNGCSLMVSQSEGAITIEYARTEMLRMIENSRRELMRMMLTKPSVLPKTLIESFFYLHQISYYFYIKNDEYRIPTKRIVDDMNGLLYEPLDLLP